MQQLRLNRKLAFDHYIGGPLAWLLNISACLIAKVIRRDHSLTGPPRAVLFIKFIGLGSVVRGSFLVTAVRAKYPDAKIYFASFPAVSPLVSMFDEVDEVKVVRDDTIPHLLVDTLELLFWCWRKKIDLVIDLELHAKYSAIVSVLSMARDRAGFAGISSRFRRGLYTHLVFWNPVRYIGKAYRQLAEALALPDASEAPISIPPSAQAEAVQCLQTLGWTSEMRIIGINPNASDLRTERKWPERYFAALIDMLPADQKFMVVVFGSRDEWQVAENVRTKVTSTQYPVHNIAGKVSFAALCEILKRLSIFVTNDSGPMHIARSFNTPTVSLWGPTHPVNYCPPGGRHIALYRPVYCSPCTHATDVPPCGGDNQCLQRIEPVKALRAVCTLLKIPVPQTNLTLYEAPQEPSVLGYWRPHSVPLPGSSSKG